jgi:tetratricopeptide (TPR) repeat protein
MNSPESLKLHLSIAETGKLLALKGRHTDALEHYREALRLAVSSRAPEIFFRHYTQCVLESLELTGAYAEVIEFCINADSHYASLGLNSSLHRRDHGSVLERLGLAHLKNGDAEPGQAALEKAHKIAGDGVLPITEEVLGWLKRGFRPDTTRILGSQRKHKYFVVRSGQVDRKRARPISSLNRTTTANPGGILTG